MNNINNQFPSIEQVTDQYLHYRKVCAEKKNPLSVSFQELLEEKKGLQEEKLQDDGLRFSKHASQRLLSRNINLSQEQQERLQTGAERAEAKGIRESLVLMDSLAFIVNIPNKTVVTAMDQKESEENVYTNIDGAVVI